MAALDAQTAELPAKPAIEIVCSAAARGSSRRHMAVCRPSAQGLEIIMKIKNIIGRL
jgi:hypothetical protein